MATEGLLITNNKSGYYAAIQATNRQVLVSEISRCVSYPEFKEGLEEGNPILRVELCGELIGCCGGSVDYMTIDDIPHHSVPCPCGNPKHWLIKYEEESE